MYAIERPAVPLSVDLPHSSFSSLSLTASASVLTSSLPITQVFAAPVAFLLSSHPQPLTPSHSIVHYTLRFQNVENASVSIGISSARRALPFFGCDACSYGMNCASNQLFHNSLPMPVPFSTGCVCHASNQHSFLLHAFVDTISGFFWVVNEREEIVTYPCEFALSQPVFFGFVIHQAEPQCVQIELRQVFDPVLSQHTAFSYLSTMNTRLLQGVQEECSFFSAQLQTPHGENQIRFYAKQMSYLVQYYTVLFLSQLRFTCPFPAALVDALQEDLVLRERVRQSFSALFVETGERREV